MTPGPSGSRSGLVTWTVVTSFLFVISTIFAIYYYVDATGSRKISDDMKTKYAEVVTEVGLSGPEAMSLRQVRTSMDLPASTTLLDVAIEQSKRLAKLAAGTEEPEKARLEMTNALATSVSKAKAAQLDVQADNLSAASKLVSNGLEQRNNDFESARKQANDASAALVQKEKDTSAQIEAMNKTIEGIRAEQGLAIASVTDITKGKDDQITTLQGDTDTKLKESQDAINQKDVLIQDLQRKVGELQREVDNVRSKLNEGRPDTTKPLLNAADGQIVRITGGPTVYINLGSADQIIPGMSFEVYDKLEGIPAPGDPLTDVNLPKGKASLEVVRVGASSSECRIVRSMPRAAMTEGDLIANLVYDRNTQFKFMVFGSFDLDQDGKASPQDAEVVKRLITQWGAEVQMDVNVDTDFVVLGKEPILPALTAEERDDPVKKAQFDAAVAEAEMYATLRGKALDYRIPILNQNRFLYMIGYYEQAKR